MIPPLEDGVLPEGVHDCTADEMVAAFGRYQQSDRRMVLAAQIRAYLDEARRSGIVEAVMIDGRFVSAKDEPEDVDLIVVLQPDAPPAHELKPFQYNAVSRFVIKRTYRFDAYAVARGSADYDKWVEFFGRVRVAAVVGYTTRIRKGLLWVPL